MPSKIAKIAGGATFLLLTGFCGASAQTGGQADAPTPDNFLRDLETDRPNKTNGAHTVDAGHVVIEAGLFDYVYNRDRLKGADGRSETLGLGQINIRLGVRDDVELNFATNGYDFAWNKDFAAGRATRLRGPGDSAIGGKINLWGTEPSDEVWSTAAALQPQLKLATARRDIGNGHPEFFFGAPFAVKLPASFNLGLQTTVSWERNRDNDRAVAGWQNSVALDHDLFGLIDAYAEYWSHATSERHRQVEQTFDLGFVCRLTDAVQFDTGANIGLTRAADAIEWLAGLSVRY